MENPGLKPKVFISLRIIERPRLWKVDTLTPFPCDLGISLATRSFISRAALLVKVTAKILCAGSPH